jgi:glucokinase
MILAGDLGGTKTLLGLFERDPHRPRPVVQREFTTLDYDGLGSILQAFLAEVRVDGRRIDAAVVGVAGPVRDQAAELTNVPWRVDARPVADRTGLRALVLLNDVEAMAHAVPALAPTEKVVLQEGVPQPDGNAALISIGTGVGMSILHRVGDRYLPLPSEGGHADFAARTEREIVLLRALQRRFGRVDVERVVAGPGVANIARVSHGGACPLFPPGLAPADEPAQVTSAALDGTCPVCRESLDIFVEAMGAVAGNLAMTAVATGGLFVGGGVPPKILPALESGTFLTAFNAKAPVADLLQTMPVIVITLSEAGLLGAAVHASRLAQHAIR